jgi:hydroxymethylpyrimidine pyrophosphatase-like HAD family hydrolase
VSAHALLPKLIAVDMDGTLLDSHGVISVRNIEALRRAESAGIEIVAATGRRHCYAMRVLDQIGLPSTNAVVSSNGTVIRTIASRLLHREHMKLATAHWLCEHIAEFRNTLVLTFDKVGANGEDARGALVVEDMSDLHASIGLWMRANEPYIAQVRPIEKALDDGPPIQMMLCGEIARMRRAEIRLLEHPDVVHVDLAQQSDVVQQEVRAHEIAVHRTEYPDRDLCILDILPASCSKASALEHVAGLRGVSMQDVLAIGDNWNDVPMLQAAGHAVLMANAAPELHHLARQHGWTVGLSNDADGVASAIETALSKQPEW